MLISSFTRFSALKQLRPFLALALFAALMTATVFAQVEKGTITGLVKDSSGVTETIVLTGTGTGLTVGLQPNPVNFGTEQITYTSAPQTATPSRAQQERNAILIMIQLFSARLIGAWLTPAPVQTQRRRTGVASPPSRVRERNS